jgi:hypothetical protein
LIEPVQERQSPHQERVRGKYDNKYDKYMQNDEKAIKEFRKDRKYVIDGRELTTWHLNGWLIGISSI